MATHMKDRDERLTELLNRKSSAKWSHKKRAKMIRRLTESASEARNALGVVEQADFKLKHVSGA